MSFIYNRPHPGGTMYSRSLAILAAVSLIAAAAGTTRLAAQVGGPRWVKGAPFPEPEEELYAVTVNGKMYVIGGFGYMPVGNPPGLVYEYDPGPDKWGEKKNLPPRGPPHAQAVFNKKKYLLRRRPVGIFWTDPVTKRSGD